MKFVDYFKRFVINKSGFIKLNLFQSWYTLLYFLFSILFWSFFVTGSIYRYNPPIYFYNNFSKYSENEGKIVLLNNMKDQINRYDYSRLLEKIVFDYGNSDNIYVVSALIEKDSTILDKLVIERMLYLKELDRLQK